MKRKTLKIFSIFTIFTMLFETAFPIVASALTGGPSQPEVQSFEPVGTTQMVDISSGDFNYNIPLFDLDGYPVNISYHSGITMDQEASWVGLGWNINPGVINRNVRGIPDDFDVQKIKKEFNIKDNETFGSDAGFGVELFGLDAGAAFKGSISASLGIFYNNYKGVGMEWSVNPAISFATKIKTKFTASLGISGNSQSGLGFDPSVGMELDSKEKNDNMNGVSAGFNVSAPYNSRSGLKSLNFGYNAGVTSKHDTKGTEGINGGSAINFATQTYTPQMSMPMSNYSFSLSGKFGAEIVAHPYGTIKGYYSGQYLDRRSDEKESYGYIYQQDGVGKDDILMDFNREKDGVFTNNSTNLPLTNSTYDIYSVSGQGIGGMYRPHRGDIGILHDDHMLNQTRSGSIGLEFGFGNEFHFGVNANVNYAKSTSGAWHDGYADKLDFQTPDYSNDPLYEPAYFKNAGEKTPSDVSFYNKYGADQPVRLALDLQDTKNLESGFLYKGCYEGAGTNIPINCTNTVYYRKSKRDKRNQEIVTLNGDRAKVYGVSKTINNYFKNAHINSAGLILHSTINYDQDYRAGTSIAEISAYANDGSRYVYGLPAYNITQVEQSFAVNGGPLHFWDYTLTSGTDYKNGQVHYNSFGGENANSTLNKNGRDNYYNGTTTPAFAHSYLLTALLSSDYVDLSGDGISDDDLGNYTQFNYTMVNSDYHWRAPYRDRMANYDEGHKSDSKDDKGHLVYGEKEVWLVNSIVSKNYIAEFTIKGRRDGFGVQNIDGALNSSDSSYMLSKITIYAKKDRMLYGNNAVPIKTVHFDYDYSLCRGVENNVDNYTHSNIYYDTTKTNGKLTLKKIYYTYGNSNKGKFSPYEFHYNSNPAYFGSDSARYNLKANDRWGTFKPNDATATTVSPHLGNAEFPYTDQDHRSTKADKYASAWQLVEIDLPSSGNIKIEYESDDYAYVQNMPAMQMFKVMGFGQDNSAGSITNTLYSTDFENNYVFIKLPAPLTGTTAVQQLHDRYIASDMDQGVDGKNLYFNCLVNLDNKGNYEYVRGYAEIDPNAAGSSYGLVNDTIAWLKLNTVDIGDHNNFRAVNPISRAAWQMTRLQLPQLAFPQSQAAGSTSERITGLMGVAMDIKSFFDGFNHALRSENFGQGVYLPKCWVRLKNPNKMKLGGGSRVKRILNSDNWSNVGTGNTGAADFSYGKEFKYTTTEKQTDGTTMTISSGVASYEPCIGNEENPWHQPVSYSTENKLSPNNAFYTETPMGESFFPGASVTYGKVTESNLSRTNVNRTATGYTVHEFYTTKDYPTIVKSTDLKTVEHKSQGLAAIMGWDVEDLESASQGYTIELNDMNGKPKAESVYPQNAIDEKAYKSRVEYVYKNDSAFNNNAPGKPMRLSNAVDVINPDNTVVQSTVGLDIDATVDMRQSHTFSFSAGLEFNTDGFFIPPIIQGVIPTIIPNFASETTDFHCAVVTKVIRRYGILQKTIAYEDGAHIITENLAYDGETGEVLLTKTQNEFEDPLYNFTYPAHWAYDGMGPAYKNSRAHFEQVKIWTDSIVMPNGLQPKNYFSPGDLVAGTDSQFSMHVQKSNNHLFFIDLKGQRTNLHPTTKYSLEIIRSGRKNMQTVPIGTVTCLHNPIVTSGGIRLVSFDVNSKVINAASAEFNDAWPGQCNYIGSTQCKASKLTLDILDMANYYALNHKFHNLGRDTFNGKGFYDTSRVLKHDMDSLLHTTAIDSMSLTGGNRYTWSFPGTHVVGISLYGSRGFSLDSVASVSNPTLSSVFAEFNVTITLINGTKINGYFQLEGISNSLITCQTYCNLNPFTLVDPYQVGLAGLWRKEKDWLYLDNRNYSTSIDIRLDGTYGSFSPFWQYGANHKWNATPNLNWTWASQVTNYSKSGKEIENIDPLSRYSASVWGYNGTMPIAVAANSKYKDIAYDGFEDYNNFQNSCTQVNHWDFRQSANYHLDSLIKHTGKRSLRLGADSSTTAYRQLFNCNVIGTFVIYSDPALYYVKPCDCIGLFSPDPGKYIVSGWVKMDTSAYARNYGGASIKVEMKGASHVVKTYSAKGPIVEGWQRIDSTFNVPVGDTSIAVTLNAAPGNTTWFDDLRIYPYNGNMKTYAYDERSLKLLGELDENNYATIYEYDEQGNLIRVKKETINGVVTIKESKTGLNKRP
jgi:hypothetical protein